MATYYVKTTGDDTTGDGSSGTPWATPGKAGGSLGLDDILYIEEGTYTLTSGTANIAGGRLALPANLACTVIGHATAGITDFSARPIISAGAVTSVSIITLDGAGGQNQVVFNVGVDGETGTSNIGFNGTSHLFEWAINCTAIDCPTQGFKSLSCFGCKASYTTTRTGAGFVLCNTSYCHADLVATGFEMSGGNLCMSNCIASNCTQGEMANNYSSPVHNCIAYNCTNWGFGQRPNTTISGSVYTNCIAYGNGTFGWDLNVISGGGLIKCASGSNTSGRTDGFESFDLDAILLTADPFTNAAGGDFSLNNTAGGGLLLKSLGFGIPGQTQNIDIGAVQSAVVSGGAASSYAFYG